MELIDEIVGDAGARMAKSLEALQAAFARIRTGRAHPSLLDGVEVDYYGVATPINQVATVTVEEGRTLVIAPWEKKMVPDIEKAILRNNLGVTPTSTGDVIRLVLPPLTEENRRDLTRQARNETEHARVAIRNVRRDGNHDIREFLKEKEITEDEAHRAIQDIQKVTDERVEQADSALERKENDLMEI
jgi:ribosome recycling factor